MDIPVFGIMYHALFSQNNAAFFLFAHVYKTCIFENNAKLVGYFSFCDCLYESNFYLYVAS